MPFTEIHAVLCIFNFSATLLLPTRHGQAIRPRYVPGKTQILNRIRKTNELPYVFTYSDMPMFTRTRWSHRLGVVVLSRPLRAFRQE